MRSPLVSGPLAPADLLVRGAHVVDPRERLDGVMDVLVRGGEVAELGAGLSAPEGAEENDFPGYPLAARPTGAAWIFYLVWPLAILVAWWLMRK